MAGIERMTITLPAEMAASVKDAVGADGYASTSEVVRDALRDWQVKAELRRRKLDALRRDIDLGLEDVAADRLVEFDVDAIVTEGRRRSRKRDRSA